MNPISRDELWQRLSGAGLVSGDHPPPAAEPRSPWPIRVMLGIAGWLGALFLLGFAGAAFTMLFRSASAALPAGVICCIAAYGIFRAVPDNDFAAQFGFAISLAGQALLFIGLANLAGPRPNSATFILMAVLEVALAVAIPNYVHRVFTTVAANSCLLVATAMLGVPAVATVVASIGAALIWLDQVRIPEHPSFWHALGYGFSIGLLHLDGSLMIGPEFWRMLLPAEEQGSRFLLWVGSFAAGLVFVYVVWQLRERTGLKPDSPGAIFTIAAAIVLALCGLAAPGISAAILILVLGFANGNRILMGLGIAAFGAYLSHFYYELSSTLLVKSMVLAATGVVLLGLRWIIGRYLPEPESANA